MTYESFEFGVKIQNFFLKDMDECSDMIALLDNSNGSFWVPSSSPSFHETNMVNLEQEVQLGKRPSPKRDQNGPLCQVSDGDETGGEDYDISGAFHQPAAKKRRLRPKQVQFLEKSFEVENKLEPERKVELAKQLGLQPRQVAIWFQNRRARYKTKQLEKDYDSLKTSFDRLKADYDSLLMERENLQNEVKLLTKKWKQREDGRENPNPDNLDNPLYSEDGIPKTESENGQKMGVSEVLPSTKQVEDASSAKSDVIDSDSPHCTDGNHSSLMEDPADSSHMVDPDQQSDFSQDEEDHLMMSKGLLLSPTPPSAPTNDNFPKLEDGCYDINGSSCNFIPLVDDQPFWSFLY